MNRSISLLFAMALGMGAFAGCDNGPRCEPIPTVETCDPACDPLMGEFCNPANLECEPAMPCDPPACESGVTYCDIFTGNCVAIPETCEPACDSDERCVGTTCEPIPECTPACEADEYCTN